MQYLWTMIKVFFGAMAVLYCVVATPWSELIAALPLAGAVLAVIVALCIAA